MPTVHKSFGEISRTLNVGWVTAYGSIIGAGAYGSVRHTAAYKRALKQYGEGMKKALQERMKHASETYSETIPLEERTIQEREDVGINSLNPIIAGKALYKAIGFQIEGDGVKAGFTTETHRHMSLEEDRDVDTDWLVDRLEEGTSKMPARPVFGDPAVMRGEINDLLKAFSKEVVNGGWLHGRLGIRQ